VPISGNARANFDLEGSGSVGSRLGGTIRRSAGAAMRHLFRHHELAAENLRSGGQLSSALG
jgi:hypothetical protein